MEVDFELNKIVNAIKKSNAKKVCIQLPDGLKPKATKIVDILKKKTNADVQVWFGSNFGACDIPSQLSNLKFDLVINFGHSKI